MVTSIREPLPGPPVGRLSDDDPLPLAVAAAPGVSGYASRGDHEHSTDGLVVSALVGAPDGVASLDAGGKVPDAQLPDIIAHDQEVIDAIAAQALVTADNLLAHVSAANHPYTDVAKTWTATQTFTPATVNDPGLIVRGLASQTGDLFQAQGSTGMVLASVNSSGQGSLQALGMGAAPGSSYRLLSVARTATDIPFAVRGAASQATDLFVMQDSAGVTAARYTLDGSFVVGGMSWQVAQGINARRSFLQPANAAHVPATVQGAASQTADLEQWRDSTGTTLSRISAAGGLVLATTVGGVSAGNSWLLSASSTNNLMVSNAASNIVLAVRAAASQTGDLQRWQDSAAATRSAVDFTGRLSVLATAPISGASLTVASAGASNPVAVLKGSSSQTGDILQAQDSPGNMLFRVLSNGTVAIRNQGDAVLSVTPTGGPLTTATPLQVQNSGSGTITSIIRGAAGQSVDLTQWQDSTGGIAAEITAAGGMLIRDAGVVRLALNTSGTATMTNSTATFVPLVLKGAASQTAALQQWQDSVGTTLASVSSDGGITSYRFYAPAGSGTTAYLRENQGTGWGFAPNNATTTGARTSVSVSDTFTQAAGTNAYTGLIIQSAVNQTGGATGIVTGLFINPTLTAVTNWKGIYVGNVNAGVGYAIHTQGGVTQHETGAAGTIGMVVRGAASQTANLQEWQNSSGTTVAHVRATGSMQTEADLSVSTSPLSSAVLSVSTRAAGNVGQVIRGVASQTGDLQRWQDSAGAVLTRVAPTGILWAPSVYPQTDNSGSVGYSGSRWASMFSGSYYATTGYEWRWPSALSTTRWLQYNNDGDTNLYIRDMVNARMQMTLTPHATSPTTTLNSMAMVKTPTPSASAAFAVQGAASQTANLQEWQDSAGTVLSRVTPTAAFVIGPPPSGSQGKLSVGPGSAAGVGITVQGLASQTADLQQWQDSTAAVLAKVTSNGTIQVGNSFISGSTNRALFQANSVGQVPLTASGMVGQTGDLTQWVDSAGVVQGSVNAGGSVLRLNIPANSATASAVALMGNTWPPTYGMIRNANTAELGLVTAGRGRITTTAANEVAWIVQAAASQTASYQEWVNSAGSAAALVNSGGGATFGTAGGQRLNLNTSGFTTTALSVKAAATTWVGAAVQGLAGQSADLQQWQDSAGTALAALTSAGRVNAPTVGSTTAGKATLETNYDTGAIGIATNAAANKGLVVKGVISQSADLIQAQDFNGILRSWITASGTINVGDAAGGASVSMSGAAAPTQRMIVNPITATTLGLIVRAAASQTANLQEWQDSTAATLASVDPAGRLATSRVRPLSGDLIIGSNPADATSDVFLQTRDSANNPVTLIALSGGGQTTIQNRLGNKLIQTGSANAIELAFFGKVPIAQPAALPTDAVDLPTAIALVNAIKNNVITPLGLAA